MHKNVLRIIVIIIIKKNIIIIEIMLEAHKHICKIEKEKRKKN